MFPVQCASVHVTPYAYVHETPYAYVHVTPYAYVHVTPYAYVHVTPIRDSAGASGADVHCCSRVLRRGSISHGAEGTQI